MPVPNRRKGRRKRRFDDMKFAYAGPFSPMLDPRVGRSLPRTDEPYIPDSAESYTIGSRIGSALVTALGVRFGSNATVTNRPKRRRRRRGDRRVAA